MQQVPLIRAAHFNCYLSVLHDIGVPVWRSLQRAGAARAPPKSPRISI